MIPSTLPGGRTEYAPAGLQQFSEAAGLPMPNDTRTQQFLCVTCVQEGCLEVPVSIVMYHGTSVCAQHLGNMVD